jgi:hypothetical protein
MTDQIPTAKLRQMLEDAKKATPGPWDNHTGMVRAVGGVSGAIGNIAISTSKHPVCECYVVESDNNPVLLNPNYKNDGKHIANYDRETSIALIEEVLKGRGETP